MQTLRLSLAWAMLLSLGAAEKTLVFYREGGGDGAFVRERNGDWRWWSGVEREAGRCSAACGTNVWWLGAHATMPCTSIQVCLVAADCI